MIRHHKFTESVGLSDRTERTCIHCKCVRVTLIYPGNKNPRQWKLADGSRWQFQRDPPCVPVEVPKL